MPAAQAHTSTRKTICCLLAAKNLRSHSTARPFPHASLPQAHKATVWTARHLPQNRDVFVTTGGNGGVNIYKWVARAA